ncbi:CutC family protein copper transport [Wilcoxina mikolae CBS 423.85]|nr:CutC family protein copper transport [Wilcoxina mikolae CBS 423.85]
MSAEHCILEVCVDDAEGLLAAVSGGADRIELCSALDLGGLTPSHSLMQRAALLPIPTYAMVRPRAGDFVFSPADIDLMLADIELIRTTGLAGVVLGANRADGSLDTEVLQCLVAHSKGLGMTLHRAFDLVPDFAEAVEFAISAGFERILTSGGALTALKGADCLRRAYDAAQGRISIMPGAGIKRENVRDILAIAPFTEVHSSCSEYIPGLDGKVRKLGFSAESRRVTSARIVAELKAIVQN